MVRFDNSLHTRLNHIHVYEELFEVLLAHLFDDHCPLGFALLCQVQSV